MFQEKKSKSKLQFDQRLSPVEENDNSDAESKAETGVVQAPETPSEMSIDQGPPSEGAATIGDDADVNFFLENSPAPSREAVSHHQIII